MARKLLRKPVLALVAILAVALLAGQAQAVAPWGLITDGGFDGAAFTPAPYTAGSNDGAWLVATTAATWALSSKTAVNTTGGTDWLIQGCTLPSTCFGPGWKVKLSFDYQSSGTSQVSVYGFTTGQTWDPATAPPPGVMHVGTETFSGSAVKKEIYFSLPSGSQNFVSLGVGFNLAAGTGVSMSVDNVVLNIVASVNLKLTPKALNLKSQGNWVTAFISIPEASSCYTLADILKGEIMLSFGGVEWFNRDWYNDHGRKLMMKFDRATLIGMLEKGTGDRADVIISGAFDDGVLFEGVANIKVIRPKKPKGPKGP